jgi:glycosyltransferase-like protein
MSSLAIYTYSTLPRGSVVHAAYLAEALHDSGWDVTLYALDKDRRGFFRPLRAPLCLVPASATPSTTAELVRVRRRELAGYVVRHALHHDLHHAEDCLTGSALLDVAETEALSIVRTVHHVEPFQDPYLADCQERSIRQADLCLAVSATVEEEVRRLHGISAGRISNGVAVERFARVEPALVEDWRARLGAGAGPVVLAVGGVEERKNTLRTLRAFLGLRRRYPGARLVILGGASVLDHSGYQAAWDHTMAALPAAARAAVLELGVVADELVPALYHASDVLALPSLQEGFGLAALEALAAGLPVVASDLPPLTEFLDAGCATLVDPRSEGSIEAGLAAALLPAAARRQAGRQRARQHSWQRVAALHANHYRSIMGTLGGSPRPPATGSVGRSPPAPTIFVGTLGGSPAPPATGSVGRSPPAPTR